MFAKGDKIYADSGKYLNHKVLKVCALSIQGNQDDYEEFDMDTPIQIEIIGDMFFWQNKMFAHRPKKFDYSSIKESIVKNRYSYDDQIAIMLNKDIKEDGSFQFDKMQQWREFAGTMANLVCNQLNNDKNND